MDSNPRVFGTIISGNRQRNCEFPPEARGAMVALRYEGKSYSALATQFNTTKSTVWNIVKRFQTDQTTSPKPRKGRPVKLTKAQRKYVILLLKRDRDIAWKALIGDAGVAVCVNTLRTAVGKHYSRKWRAIERIPLNKDSAFDRLAYCRDWLPNAAELLDVFTFENAPSNAYITNLRGLYI
jgi:transposase